MAGILSKLLSAIPFLDKGNVARQMIDAEPPRGHSRSVPGLPAWLNPLTDRLNYDAYLVIRRSDATGWAVTKLARKVARYQIVCECPDDPEWAETLQTDVLDHIHGVPPALLWLTWGVVEGWRALRINHRLLAGYYVPDFQNSSRAKVSAGGSLELAFDEDQEVVYKGIPRQGGLRPEDTKPARMDRANYVIYRPGAVDSPEGDTDLAWRLYNLAFEYQKLCQTVSDYRERWGNPFTYLQTHLKDVKPNEVVARLTKMAQAAQSAPGNGVLIGQMLTGAAVVNPPTAAADFLLKARQRFRDEAHEALLDQSLTGSTAEAGPTGSSQVAERTEDESVDLIARTMGEAIDRDLGAWIRRFNPTLWPEDKRAWLTLRKPSAPKQATAAELVSAYLAGLPVHRQTYEEATGQPALEGEDDILKKEPAAFNPFGGFGSSATGDDQDDSDDPEGPEGEGGADLPPPPGPAPKDPEKVENRKAPKPARSTPKAGAALWAAQRRANLAGAKHLDPPAALDRLVTAAMEEFTGEVSKAWAAYLPHAMRGEPMQPPKSLALVYAKLRAIADITGRGVLTEQVDRAAGKVNKPRGVPKDFVKAFESAVEQPFAEAVKSMAKAVGMPADQANKIKDLFDRQKMKALAPLKGEIERRAQSMFGDFQKASVPGPDGKAPYNGSERDFIRYANEHGGGDVAEDLARVTMRNEVGVSYSQGLEAQLNEVADLVGGWQYQTAGDSAVRPEHAALDGQIFPVSERQLMPPNGFNCRCIWFVVDNQTEPTADASQILQFKTKIDPDFLKAPLAIGEGNSITPE